MKIVKAVRPPTGLSRRLYRLPLYLYRWHLGWVFGHRILVVNHIGRVTGKPRQAVLEVVTHDTRDGAHTVASGWGPTAAWYRNLQKTPEVTIQVGRQIIPVRAVPLLPDEGADLFAHYAIQHRWAAKYLLSRLMGYSVDGSEADFRAVGQRIPFVRFEPRV
ncbi:nitroreductase family deazaflavin-dependent oxidoreductase [Nocardia sp. NPDC050710]|uniref:nitroreductase family deazaflavin-dependent oxidoreductase n=1 Tax=Nocardia sp. NPDC050710 TaxID=3157220 RepID=UPI0033C8F3AF